MMPDLPWYVWFGLGALLYPWMRRIVLHVVGRYIRPRFGTVSLKRTFSRSKPSEDAPTAWDRIQENDD